MHRRLLIGELLVWYRSVMVVPVLTGLPLISLSGWLMPPGQDRWTNLTWIAATGLVAVALPLCYRQK